MSLLYGSMFIMVITDFLADIPWYIQYGPMALTWIIIIILAIFERKEDEPREIETAEDKKRGRKKWFILMLLFWFLIIGMNVFVGNPGMDALNIKHPLFWIMIVALPLLSQFNYKKSTDGTV